MNGCNVKTPAICDGQPCCRQRGVNTDDRGSESYNLRSAFGLFFFLAVLNQENADKQGDDIQRYGQI